MKKGILSILAASVVAAIAFAPSAQAQATRTWVSGVGDDVNPCSRTAPCKTYAGAISKTAAGGEISTLDPGGFGSVTITKSITINGDATIGGILASLTNGVTVNNLATDRVVLRNLSINGAGNGLQGVRMLNASGKLVIDRCVIQNFRNSATSRGIDVALTGSGQIHILNTVIADNSNGVRLSTTAGQLLAFMDGSSIVNSTTGVGGAGFEAAAGNTVAQIRNSNITNNAGDGVKASGASTQITVDSSSISINAINAINASVAGARIRLANNVIANNNVSIAIAAGAFVDSTTPASNRVVGNGGGVAPNGVGAVTQQ
jgi:hypothetical protein